MSIGADLGTVVYILQTRSKKIFRIQWGVWTPLTPPPLLSTPVRSALYSKQVVQQNYSYICYVPAFITCTKYEIRAGHESHGD